MSEEKYPTDIIETVAKAIGQTVWADYQHTSDPDRDEFEDYAVAALDALGLNVTEEWKADAVPGARWVDLSNMPGAAERHARQWAGPGERVMRHTVLHAETPWVEVES